MTQPTIIFIHGYRASPEINWFSEISRELKKLDIPHLIPTLPGGDNPHSAEWLKIIDKTIKSVKTPVILVGHSLGTRAVLLYLDKFKTPVRSVLLVSPFNNDLSNAGNRGGGYSDFFEYPVNIPAVKKLASKFIVMHSKDDQAIPFEQGQEIAKELGAEFVVYEDRHHFAKPENYVYILEQLKKLI